MYRLYLVLLAPLALCGCLQPVTSRLDRTNAQLALTNMQLEQVNAQLRDANNRLDGLTRQIESANQTLARTAVQVEATNTKLAVFEKALRNVPSLKLE
jgi:septal ring factor EnvC (AmiA/AmiB activator)